MARISSSGSGRPSLWQRIKQVAFTDARVLAEGLDEGSIEEIETLLLAADFGVPVTGRLIDELEARSRAGQVRTAQEFREVVEAEVLSILLAGERDGRLLRTAATGPSVFVIVGVNGVGKTTTIAKLAHRLQKEGHTPLLAAADTFRAGAIEQLRVWAERVGASFVGGAPGADPASVAFDAIDAAENRGADIVLIDTAGRLHTQADLMTELQKVERVVARRCQGGPQETLLVLDATVGQNAIAQARTFGVALALSGLVLAKLDSTARGGIVVALKQEFDLPVKFIGTGESLDALEPFDAQRFARSLFEDS